MKPGIIAVALMVVVPGVLLFAPTGASVAFSAWSEEIPGVAVGVDHVKIDGVDGNIGVAYHRLSDGLLGFALRATGTSPWSIRTSDVSGNSTQLTKPDICYANAIWYMATQNVATSHIWVYTSNTSGATWNLVKDIQGTVWGGSLSCVGQNVALTDQTTYNVTGVVRVFISYDGGASWNAAKQLASLGGGTAQFTGSGVVWLNSSHLVAAFAWWISASTYRIEKRTSDDGGLFWTSATVVETNTVTNNVNVPFGLGIDAANGHYAITGFRKITSGNQIIYRTYYDGGSPLTVQVVNDNVDYDCQLNSCPISINSYGQQLTTFGSSSGNGFFSSVTDSAFYRDTTTSFTVETVSLPITGQFSDTHLTDTAAYIAYRDSSQGNRLEIKRAGVVPPDTVGGGADISIPITGGTGLSVDPTGFTALVRVASGATVSIYDAASLNSSPLGQISTADCSRFGGVDALPDVVAVVSCKAGGDPDQILIRNRAGLVFSPPGCEPDYCPEDINMEDLDMQDIIGLAGLRWNYEKRHDDTTALPNGWTVIAWGFSTFDGRVGVFAEGTRNNNIDLTRIAGIVVGGASGVDDICVWRNAEQSYIAFADQDLGLWRAQVNIAIHIAVGGGLQDLDVTVGNPTGYSSGTSFAQAIDCHGTMALIATAQTKKVILLDPQTGAIYPGWPKTVTATKAKGVALSDDQQWLAYLDGPNMVYAKPNGTVLATRALPGGNFVDMDIDQRGTAVWVLTSTNLAKYDFFDVQLANPVKPPKECGGITNETALAECLDGNPACMIDTDHDGVVNCLDPDDDNDGTPDGQDCDSDGDDVENHLDPDSPRFGATTCLGGTATGGGTNGGVIGNPQFPGVDFDALNGVAGVSSTGWAWVIGAFLVVGATAAGFGIAAPINRRAMIPMALAGAAFGLVLAVAFSLWPLWALLAIIFLVAAALFLRSRI